MSSRRYQSQLFRFVAQQTQKVADKTATLGRHAKVAAIWTTQILLYPVYAVFQTTRLTGRQIGVTVQKTVLKLQLNDDSIDGDTFNAPLAVDAPIQNVLTSIKQALLTNGDLPKPERNPIVLIGRLFQRFKRPAIVRENERSPHSITTQISVDQIRSELQPATNLLTPNPDRIQGVASLTDTRHLVLILEGNVILDILTIEQQRQIDQRMIWQLARYWRRRRRFRLNQAPLSLPDDRPTLLPPVRVFRQLMAWIQTSPVAIAANLFQETKLDAPTPSQIDWFSPSVPLSAFNPGNLMPRELPKSENLGAWFAALPKWAELEAIVWAAIHYFFGNEKNRIASASAQIPAAETLLITEVYGESLPTQQPQFRTKTVQLAAQPPRSRQELTIRSRSIQHWIGGSWHRVTQAIVVFNQTRKAVLTGTESEEIIATQASHRTTSRAEKIQVNHSAQPLYRSSSGELATEPNPTPNAKRSTLEHTPDWIETSVRHVEYVRSPLQKALSWIDSGISWIERKIVALWRWIRRR